MTAFRFAGDYLEIIESLKDKQPVHYCEEPEFAGLRFPKNQ